MKKHVLLLSVFLLVFAVAKAQPGYINTIAGGGVGDNSLAVNASLYYPFSVAVDNKLGNVYISDFYDNRIRKVSLITGIISTVAGNGVPGYSGDEGPATNAELYDPRSVAVDTAGNLYIADTYNNRIREVDAKTGIITTCAGGGTGGLGNGGKATECTFDEPWGVSVDIHGNIYIVDTYNAEIREVTKSTGIINVVAGDRTYGSSGDGGPATDAEITYDAGMAVDTAGNMYIADEENCTIRYVNAKTGIISIYAGITNGYGFGGDGGPATDAYIYYPSDCALDDSGNLYIADLFNSRVRKVTAATGIIETWAGNGYYGYSSDGGPGDTTRLNQPTGVAIDQYRNCYIADFENNRIRKVDTNDIITTFAGGAGVGDGGTALDSKLNFPLDIALDKSDNVFIADLENDRVREISTSTGIISTIAGNGIPQYTNDNGMADTSSLYLPSGVATDDSGNVYILTTGDARLRKVNTSKGTIATIANRYGVMGYNGDNIPDSTAEFYFLQYIIMDEYYAYPINYGIALDDSNNIYVADGNNRIRKINAKTGIVTTVAGNGTPGFSGDGGPATDAELNNPTSVAFDASGNLYFTDFLNYRVREVNASTGIISTVAGGGIDIGQGEPATEAALYPTSVTLDSSGNIYFADVFNNMIREVNKTTGIITTVAGDGIQGFSGDDGPAVFAELYLPYGLAFDQNYNFYIGDTYNNRAREVNALPRQKATGINQVNASPDNIETYPNPTSNTINIKFGSSMSSGDAVIKVSDVTGRELIVLNKSITAGSDLAIDISSYPAGMYFVSFNMGQYSEVTKVIKQ